MLCRPGGTTAAAAQRVDLIQMLGRARRSHCIRRTIPRCRAAAVSALAAVPEKVLRLDHFFWVRRAGSLLLLLVFLLSVRHLLWYRASAGLLLATTAIEAADSWTVSPSSIAGVGVHATRPLKRGASLGPSVVWEYGKHTSYPHRDSIST